MVVDRKNDDETNDNEYDWRDFRARLVAQEAKEALKRTVSAPSSSTTDHCEESDAVPSLFPMTSMVASSSTNDDDKNDDSGPQTWTYEMGDIIEEGCVILSRHQHDFCYGLKQQYFHKSIMLVLEHDETTMTDGIILNRPASQVLVDEDGNVWNLWYGGPVRGMHTVNNHAENKDDYQERPAYTCLHSLTNEVAMRVSNKIIKHIQWTTLDAAQFLVKEGHANPDDFQVYVGFAGWSPGQLRKELERKNWYMASVDSNTILEELLLSNSRKDAGAATANCVEAMDAFGIETWRRFAERIGRVNSTATVAVAEATAERFDDCMLLEWIRTNLLSNDTVPCSTPMKLPPTFAPGTILRASHPFLLDNQEFHKSLLLILEDTAAVTIGVLLNLPGAENISISDETIPIRYGGKFGIRGQTEKPVTWYHNDDSLRNARVGTPVGSSWAEVWSCTPQDAETAIDVGLATLDDFVVVRGATVLPKKNKNGISALAALSEFQVVPRTRVPKLWNALLSQEGASKDTLDEYTRLATSIWEQSAGDTMDSYDGNHDFLEEQDLSSVAWKSWIATFLLACPELRGC